VKFHVSIVLNQFRIRRGADLILLSFLHRNKQGRRHTTWSQEKIRYLSLQSGKPQIPHDAVRPRIQSPCAPHLIFPQYSRLHRTTGRRWTRRKYRLNHRRCIPGTAPTGREYRIGQSNRSESFPYCDPMAIGYCCPGSDKQTHPQGNVSGEFQLFDQFLGYFHAPSFLGRTLTIASLSHQFPLHFTAATVWPNQE
jgi:hypothetical protein